MNKKEYDHLYHKKHKEKKCAVSHAYYWSHREEVLQKNKGLIPRMHKERHPKTAEEIKAYFKAWKDAHPSYSKEWYFKHREQALIKSRKYYWSHKKEISDRKHKRYLEKKQR